MKITGINHISFNSIFKPPIYNVPVDTNRLYPKTEAIDLLLEEWNKAKTNIVTLESQITQANNQFPKDTRKLVQLNLDKAFWVQLQISLEHQIEVMRKAPDDQKMKIRINTEY